MLKKDMLEKWDEYIKTLVVVWQFGLEYLFLFQMKIRLFTNKTSLHQKERFVVKFVFSAKD